MLTRRLLNAQEGRMPLLMLRAGSLRDTCLPQQVKTTSAKLCCTTPGKMHLARSLLEKRAGQKPCHGCTCVLTVLHLHLLLLHGS